MITSLVTRSRRHGRAAFNSLLVTIAASAIVFLVTASAAVTPARAQPLLLQMAAQQPDSTVGVIVQKSGQDNIAEEAVANVGGQVTKDLHIINAFAAQVPAGAVPQLARADGVRWLSLDAPVQQSAGTTGSSPKFTTWASQIGTTVANGFTNPNNMIGAAGPNKLFGYGSRVKGAFGGFLAEYKPGLIITKVEARLRLYVPATLGSTEAPKITPYVKGVAGTPVAASVSAINAYLGSANANIVSVDLTKSRTWRWSDFRSDSKLEILIDQSALATTHSIYYDAVGLRITTASGTDSSTSLMTTSTSSTFAPVDTTVLSNQFNKATRATEVWNEAPGYYQGQNVTIAVVDSGFFQSKEVAGRLLGQVNFNSSEHTNTDGYGHGTFVGGIIGDDGSLSGGKYIGIAPQANLINVRVSDDNGMAYESDVVNGLQWINDNRATYNIEVVNLSMNAGAYESYNTNPLDAAVEILWFNGITVVVSAGNNGTATLFPPANDPFVITVGATNDVGTQNIGDDTVASFSAYGADDLGGAKPDLVAPGSNIIAYLPDNNQLTISTQHPANRVDSNYFRMSGTSMSAPMVSGAVAMLLQSNPNLTPDQIKYRLMATANKSWTAYSPTTAGAGYLDVYAAVHGTSTESANTGKLASQLLWTGSQPVTWGSVNWNSVNWNSVNWNSVNWTSVNWNSVNWNSDSWGQ